MPFPLLLLLLLLLLLPFLILSSSLEEGQWLRSLCLAVSNDDVPSVVNLLKQQPNYSLNLTKEDGGDTVLHVACRHDEPEIVEILLHHPHINPNAKNRNGETPLWVAATTGNANCVSLLLGDDRVEAGEPDERGIVPLTEAANRNHLEVIQWWVASEQKWRNSWIGQAKAANDASIFLKKASHNREFYRTKCKNELEIKGVEVPAVHPSCFHLTFFFFLSFFLPFGQNFQRSHPTSRSVTTSDTWVLSPATLPL